MRPSICPLTSDAAPPPLLPDAVNKKEAYKKVTAASFCISASRSEPAKPSHDSKCFAMFVYPPICITSINLPRGRGCQQDARAYVGHLTRPLGLWVEGRCCSSPGGGGGRGGGAAGGRKGGRWKPRSLFNDSGAELVLRSGPPRRPCRS